MEELAIYKNKTLKYCVSCLHTEEQLHDSWICSWCVRRLENSRNLLENFQRAQYLLANIAEGLNSSSTSPDITKAFSSEISELKSKSRLNVSNFLDSDFIYPKVEIKTEEPDGVLSDSEVENNFNDGFEMDITNLDNTDSIDCQYRSTRSRKVKRDLNSPKKVKTKIKEKSKGKKKKSLVKKKLDNVKSEVVIQKDEIRKKKENESMKSEAQSLGVSDEKSEELGNLESGIYHGKVQDSPNEAALKYSTIYLHDENLVDELVSDTAKLDDKVEKRYNKPRASKVSRTASELKPVKNNRKARPYLPHLPRLSCTECDQLFIKKIALENHIYRDHKKKFRCELCDKKFTREDYLKTHMARQHEPKSGIFECDICGIIYKHRVKIVAHMIKHEKYGPSLKDIEKIVCHHCGKICDRNHISNHLLTHSETKGYPCTYCDASFKVAQILENHVKRKHLDPDIGRTFLCPQCPKKFYTSTEVKYHVKAAHLFQSHPCPHCSKSFPIKGNLRAHILRVHEKVPALRDKKCDLCDKAFSTRRHLRHHRYTHTGEKPYKCDLCSSAYNQKYCLTLHKRRAHNIDKSKTVIKDFNNPTVSNIPIGEEFSNNVGNWFA